MFKMSDYPEQYKKLASLTFEKMVRVEFTHDELAKSLVDDLGYTSARELLKKYRPASVYNSKWFDQDVFPSGKAVGEAHAEFVRESVFVDLEKHTGSTRYDDDLYDFKVEQKTIRALGPISLGSYLDRAQTKAKSTNKTRTWQQVKPDHFDLFLASVIYADRTDFYLVPSNDICKTIYDRTPGKIRLQKQHNKGESWGQISPFGDLIESYIIGTSTAKQPLENLSLASIVEDRGYTC